MISPRLLFPGLLWLISASCLPAQDGSIPFVTKGSESIAMHTSPFREANSPAAPASNPPPAASSIGSDLSVKEYFTQCGIEFPPGSSAVLVHRTGQLVVHNTLANQQKVEALLSGGDMKRVEEPDSIKETRMKAGVIILPRVNFGNATLMQAVDYLEREAARVERTPGGGLNIALRDQTASGESPSAETAPAAVSASRVRINLRLSNVSLEEALKQVARQAGLTYKVEPHSVILEPKDPAETSFSTRVYPAPPM